jgi:hypothetical protein
MTCRYCHANNAGVVTSLADGVFHASLTNFRMTVGAPITPLAQPMHCGDCHTARPHHIVEEAASSLIAMDHAATFAAPVSIGGVMAAAASDLDCSTCHHAAGQSSWADGVFHANIGSAVPADCTTCHYPLMADAAKADLTAGTRYQMRHRSPSMTTQACATCHAMALAKATMTPAAGPLWQTGAYHASLTTQPAACNDCHAVAEPAAATQGTTTYTLAQGGTTSNAAQWMNHASSSLAGKDCAACHAADAVRSGAAWNRASRLHGPVASASTCNECHGLGNGRGTVVGTNNNLPSGLVDAAGITSASAATGVPAGTHDQITHTDINVTGNECKLCHTQQGASTAAGVMGQEWAQAAFHRNFNANKPLVVNGTTGRCSHCHLNVKPRATYTGQDHSAFTDTSAQDCSGCHSFPGTNANSPNWLGASGRPHDLTGSTAASALDCGTCHGMGGSASVHLSVATASHYGGVSNGNTCTSCHIDFTAFNGPVTNLQYAHTNAAANANGCTGCHNFVNQLYTTMTTTPVLTHPVSAGSHQFSQTTNVTGSKDSRTFTANHTNANLTRCGACHQYSTTTPTTNIWAFKHRPSNPGISNSTSSSGCNMCH